MHLSLGPKRLGVEKVPGEGGEGVGVYAPALFLFFSVAAFSVFFPGRGAPSPLLRGGGEAGRLVCLVFPSPDSAGEILSGGRVFSGTPFWGRSGGASPGCTINNQLRTGTDKGNPTV